MIAKTGYVNQPCSGFLLGLSTSRSAQDVILRCKNTFFTDGIAPGGDPVLKLAGNAHPLMTVGVATSSGQYCTC